MPGLVAGVGCACGTAVGKIERGVAVGGGVAAGIAVAAGVGDCVASTGGAGAVAAGVGPVPQATSTSTVIDSAVAIAQRRLFSLFGSLR
ncbi:MAG: hypothetical protein IIC23_06720 [Chloroflexi bacterium]|nr:hypothetical protein [Chloroflexota bacterium]